MTSTIGIVREEVSQVLTLLSEWPSSVWWIIAIVVSAFLYATYYYWRRAREAVDKIHLAPISVKGGISQKLGSREAGLLLHAQLSTIIETFRKDRTEQASIYMVNSASDRFRSIHAAMVSAPLELGQSEVLFKEELVVKIGAFQIPISAIVNLFVALLRVLPVPFRRRYIASLIHVSLVSVGDETQLLVHRQVPRSRPPESAQPQSKNAEGKRATVLAQTRTVKSLAKYNDLLREAAFMLLELHGKAFPGRISHSMRYFADGLKALDEYQLMGDEELMTKAEESFSRAVASDPDNSEALYFYGSLLLLHRTRESIARAIKVFTRALKTDKHKLKSLVHAGLANCYAQEFHRLAKREEDVLKKARQHAEEARQDWQEKVSEDLHPWIFSTLALVQIVDEGTDKTREDAKKRFLEAACLYFQAIKREPDNGMLYNNLGWVLLKLAEWRVENLKAKNGIPPQLLGNPAEIADKYLHCSLDMNPKNKLSHANLCLLYATPRYLADREKHLDRCRYHGLKAIRLDREYINGHRDFSLSLIRYGEYDEAYKYFEDALRLAVVVEKDMEIISDVVKVLQKMKVGAKEQDRWRHPDPQLLEPPDASGASPAPGKGDG